MAGDTRKLPLGTFLGTFGLQKHCCLVVFFFFELDNSRTENQKVGADNHKCKASTIGVSWGRFIGTFECIVPSKISGVAKILLWGGGAPTDQEVAGADLNSQKAVSYLS